MPLEKVDVPASPGRLISAVANIGYDPEVALCDLIDNSIDANAKKIHIELEKERQGDEGRSDTIESYTIVDDGDGMDRPTLIGAFTLGTERTYPKGSLGKFGLGLKSAGLSLGNEIVVLTQRQDNSPLCAKLSISDIEQSGVYQIDLGDIPDEYAECWETFVLEGHGTILMIRNLVESRPSYSSFSEYLKRCCSTVYHRFLERESSIEMFVGSTRLDPFDPLFFSEAESNGSLADPSGWDGKSVHLLLEDKLNLGGQDASIAATHLIHPPSFEKDRAKMAQAYGIETDPYTRRPRHGFYVYRNERIIVLAERFHGLIHAQTQNWAFKARLMFDESADDLLSLDVKKRHCQLPKRARQNLKAMIGTYQAKSAEAWKSAGSAQQEKRRESSDDVANENIANTPITSLEYMPGTTLDDDAQINARKERQGEISNETKDAIHDENSEELLEKHEKDGDVVIPVNGLKANAMWLPYPAPSHGKAETIVNKAHTWVSEAYNAAEKEPNVTIILHHLFTILARAELEVRSTPWNDISADQLDKVFDRFRKKASAIGEDLAEHLSEALNDDSLGDAVE